MSYSILNIDLFWVKQRLQMNVNANEPYYGGICGLIQREPTYAF